MGRGRGGARRSRVRTVSLYTQVLPLNAFFPGNNYRPPLVGIAGTAADVDDATGERPEDAVEGWAGKAGLTGSRDGLARPDGPAGLGEKVQEPGGAELRGG